MAPKAPSIKGSVFGPAVDDVRRCLEQEALTREALGKWLGPGDAEYLDAPVLVSDWYPLDTYGRLSLLLRDVEGKGHDEYLREKGRETARRLLEAGLYAQLEYLHRTEASRASDPQERYAAYGRDLRLLATLSGSILNFSTWTPRPDEEHPQRYVIDITEAAAFPEPFLVRMEGFVNEMASQHGEKDLWRLERVSRDLVRFRMTRPL